MLSREIIVRPTLQTINIFQGLYLEEKTQIDDLKVVVVVDKCIALK